MTWCRISAVEIIVSPGPVPLSSPSISCTFIRTHQLPKPPSPGPFISYVCGRCQADLHVFRTSSACWSRTATLWSWCQSCIMNSGAIPNSMKVSVFVAMPAIALIHHWSPYFLKTKCFQDEYIRVRIYMFRYCIETLRNPHLPRKRHRQSGGEQGTPRRTSDPLQCTKAHACHAKVTGRAAETKGRQGVHPTPCTWVSEWVSEWASEWGREWVREWEWVSEWVGGWVSQWMSEGVNEWVSECVWEDGAGGQGADTALKTKTALK